MARTVSQVQDSLKATALSINPTIDLVVGPLYNNMIAPVAPEIATAEASVERLQIYYSANFADVATAQEARDFAINFATGPSVGGVARGSVTYYRNSVPLAGEIYTVNVGDLVASSDSRLLFRVTQTTQMIGDYASTFYNPSTNKYELSVLVEATAAGVLYNIPAGRIVRIMSPNTGFDGVTQIAPMAGGSEPETIAQTVARVQSKFLGLDLHTVGGIIYNTQAQYPAYVQDVHVVRPTDRMEFRRVTDGPSIDLYVLGLINSTFSEDYLATGGESTVSLTNKTCMSVSSVTVGGTALDSGQWLYVPDTSLAYQGSTKATPKIQLLSALAAGTLVEVVGVKNALLDSVQAMYTPENNSLFQTDILVRSFIEMPITVVMEVRINSGDPDTIQSEVQTFLVNEIQTIPIPAAIYPDVISDYLVGAIPEITSVKLLTFNSTYNSMSAVEPIIPLKNQRPMYDVTNSNIVVRN